MPWQAGFIPRQGATVFSACMGPEMQDRAAAWPGSNERTEQSVHEDVSSKGMALFTTPC